MDKKETMREKSVSNLYFFAFSLLVIAGVWKVTEIVTGRSRIIQCQVAGYISEEGKNTREQARFSCSCSDNEGAKIAVCSIELKE